MIGSKELYDVFEVIYPVGIIIELATDANPKDLFQIGEWEQIKDKFILAAGDSATAGSTGGQDTIILSEANIPAHTHTRGTMEITGAMNTIGHIAGVAYGISLDGTSYSGAFSKGSQKGTTYALTSTSGAERINGFQFTASKSWTGETSSVGEGEAFSNMPPYYVAYMWKRVA